MLPLIIIVLIVCQQPPYTPKYGLWFQNPTVPNAARRWRNRTRSPAARVAGSCFLHGMPEEAGGAYAHKGLAYSPALRFPQLAGGA